MDAILGIIFAILSMLGFGLSNAISKTASKRIGVRKTIFFRNLFIPLMILIVLFVFPEERSFSVMHIFIAVILSILGYIPLLTYYKGLKVGKVGIVSPVANSSVIFTVLFSLIFFGEKLKDVQAFSIAIIIIGIILISLDMKDIKKSSLFDLASGVPYALVTCFLWGIVITFMKIPVSVIGPVLTTFIIETGIGLTSGLHLKLSGIDYKLKDKKTFLIILLVSFFGAVGILFYNMGIDVYNVSIVAAISFSNPLVSTLYGMIVYKEKLQLQQYVAVCFTIVGIILLAYY